MSQFFNKIFLLIVWIIVSNIMFANSIKERIIWFRPNRSELNSSETMDYTSNSSSDLSSNALNEMISNDLDVIEREIKVSDEKNNKKNYWKDFKYSMDFLKDDYKRNKNQNTSEFEYKTENNLDFYVERNLLNVQNSSDENINEFEEFSTNDNNLRQIKDISIDISNDNFNNHSLIDSDNIEIENIFVNDSKLDLRSDKKVSLSEKSINNSLIKTATTESSDVKQVSKSWVSLRDKNLKNSKPNPSENISENNAIIAVDTTDSSITTQITTHITNKSNSLIDRLKYLNAKEVKKNLTKIDLNNIYNNKSTAFERANESECGKFIDTIYLQGDTVVISFEPKPEHVVVLCLFLTCNHYVCNSTDRNRFRESCLSPKQNCINKTECVLPVNGSDINCGPNYISVVCSDSNNCWDYPINFVRAKRVPDNKVVVIITATVVPIIICVAIFTTIVYFRKNKNMKKFDCFGVKILKQMPYKSKSRKRRVDKMPTDASAGTAIINMEEVSQQHKVISKSKAVKFDEFSEYYIKNRADSGLKLAEEYEELKELTAKKRSMKISQFTINKTKNRFVNILPYDHSIVSIRLKNGVIGSDYINANFIAGFNSDKEYIASQGPLYSTVNDFFRMTIEHNIRIVVCLTQCIEKGRSKCEKYWPNNDDIDEIDEDSSHSTVPKLCFDDITIELCDETIENEFVVRELKLTKDGSHHFVTQYHFTQWPDFGCPQNPYSLINLIEVIRNKFQTISQTNSDESQQNFYSPILVHCSAGVGRSGTFIAVDKIMQMFDKQLKCDKIVAKDIPIDIFGTVCDMRKNRPNMVQTEDQYIFIYDCIKYLIDRFENKSIKTIEENDNSEPNFKITNDLSNEQNSGQNSIDVLNNSVEDLCSGAHINRQFSMDESSENTEL